MSGPRQVAAVSAGLVLLSAAGGLVGHLWPYHGPAEWLGLLLLVASLAAMASAIVQAVQTSRETREAFAALARSQAELRAFLATRSPAERAQLAEQLPGFRPLLEGEGRE